MHLLPAALCRLAVALLPVRRLRRAGRPQPSVKADNQAYVIAVWGALCFVTSRVGARHLLPAGKGCRRHWRRCLGRRATANQPREHAKHNLEAARGTQTRYDNDTSMGQHYTTVSSTKQG